MIAEPQSDLRLRELDCLPDAAHRVAGALCPVQGGPGEVDRPGPWSVPHSKGFNERDAAKIPGPQGHVAASPLGAGGGKATREHRTRGRTQRSERQFPALRAPPITEFAGDD
jgi:hypothetical protein